MTFSEHTLIALNIALCLQLFGMIFALIIDPYIGKRNKSIMIISAVLVLTLVAQQQAEMYFYQKAMTLPRTVASVYGYCIRPVIICMFMQLFGRIRWPWILIGINAVIYSTAFFSDIAFTYGADQAFVRGPLGFSCHFVSAVMLIIFVYLTIKHYRSNTNKVSVFPIIIAVLIAFGSFSDVFFMTHYIIDTATVVTVSSCLFYYIWLHLRFVSEHESDLKAEQRIKIMMSQIQPHFLFNTLTTIQSLCTSDPELAADTVQKFGVYLRRNIDSLNTDMLISFKKELEYTKVYSDIEKIRFPNIRLDYDIQDKD